MKSETLMAQKKAAALGSKATKSKGAKTVQKPVSKTIPARVAASKASAKSASAKSTSAVSAKGKAVTSGKKAAKAAVVKANVKIKPVTIAASKPPAKPAKSAPQKPAPKVGASGSKASAPAAPKQVAKPAPATAQPRSALAAEKPQGPKITAPAPAPSASAPPKVAQKPAQAAGPVEKKPEKPQFKVNEYVVYPTQGVGKVIGIEEEEIAGMKLELFKIEFEKERLVLRVPMGKVPQVGMRKIADDATVKGALETLKGRARIKRTMWSRRAQEYVAKINSGNLTSIAEVVRDLYRSEAQPEQSYSERQLYEDALERMAREVAIVEKLDERGAVQRITEILSKSAKGRATVTDLVGGEDDAKAA